MMNGSKVWMSPSRVSGLLSEFNWRIQYKNIPLSCSLLQCLYIIIIYSGVVSKNQQKATQAASSKMVKPFQSTNDSSGVRGYFVSQYIIT